MKSTIHFKKVSDYNVRDHNENDIYQEIIRGYTIDSLKNTHDRSEGKNYSATIVLTNDGTNTLEIETVLNGSEYQEKLVMRNFRLIKEPEYSEIGRDVTVELEVLPGHSQVFSYQHWDYSPLFEIYIGS
ncbi:hypothetical protein [Wolbachia endosymbiont of Folsomia candida]|uniref:hypothetical protein n=1 Tax=Wolbachia endosymbiont of Folsomia candida TaxID=169402 RepID=UPI000ACEB4DB|nr:hypothetical protein [Wolbachia endosymbiont of Folsomia candida]APR98113.1 hypothetical protein ASM33_02245 [Wolbachia endosymbiont of Folsomia candida]